MPVRLISENIEKHNDYNDPQNKNAVRVRRGGRLAGEKELHDQQDRRQNDRDMEFRMEIIRQFPHPGQQKDLDAKSDPSFGYPMLHTNT